MLMRAGDLTLVVLETWLDQHVGGFCRGAESGCVWCVMKEFSQNWGVGSSWRKRLFELG